MSNPALDSPVELLAGVKVSSPLDTLVSSIYESNVAETDMLKDFFNEQFISPIAELLHQHLAPLYYILRSVSGRATPRNAYEVLIREAFVLLFILVLAFAIPFLWKKLKPLLIERARSSAKYNAATEKNMKGVMRSIMTDYTRVLVINLLRNGNRDVRWILLIIIIRRWMILFAPQFSDLVLTPVRVIISIALCSALNQTNYAMADEVQQLGKKEFPQELEEQRRALVLSIKGIGSFSIGVIFLLLLRHYVKANLQGLLSAFGVSGIIVGFSSQQIFASLFGGLMLYLQRPFNEGDVVASSDGKFAGIVQSIGASRTVLKQPDGQTIFVPNSVFVSAVVKNESTQSWISISQDIPITAGRVPAIGKFIKQIRTNLVMDKRIDQDTSRVYVSQMNPDGSLMLRLEIRVSTANGVSSADDIATALFMDISKMINNNFLTRGILGQ
eukprot:CAMPEP_0184698928 /NCGR_PEP_ID=MMETSP0313-20130426/5368_1 /TAXON_ID=2792 /ORGANISM="Porphyridium aerugineum, Strain SAG 1380-2" /LENGTH=442 /DNA_ID=CAMNT_0027157929 /DNA_START=208 /DNA_END=1536 /DNA_ORIENTATION=+